MSTSAMQGGHKNNISQMLLSKQLMPDSWSQQWS